MIDPIALFAQWYEEAQLNPLVDPGIVALASATPLGRPSVRMMLYRGIREGGFSFFSNYESRKGLELLMNPYAAMVFYWPHLGRQVRIEGRVERLSRSESDNYFQSRPQTSRVTAALSHQSRPLLDPDAFDAECVELDKASDGQELRRPDEWGGFKILPNAIEFWTHREHRRHRRMLYQKEGNLWRMTLLYP